MPTWTELLNEISQSAIANNGVPDFDKIRRSYISKLSQYTGRNVILYATRFTTQDAPPQFLTIGSEDMNGLMAVIHGLKGKKLDLILHSPGGSIETAEALMEYLRTKFNDIRVIVPHLAQSAVTVMACGANSVVLGKHSFLGPIDPQILLPMRPSGSRFVPAQAIIDQFDKAVLECKDPTKLPAWIPILEQYAPGLLVICENTSALSESLVADWLQRWMFRKDKDKVAKSKKIASWLANHNQFKSHGRCISRRQLEQKGFVIERLEDDPKLQDAVLSVFHATMHTFNSTTTAKIIENQNGHAYLKLLQLPQQMPMQLPIQPPHKPSQP